MKNCDPFVFVPLFAIDNVPATLKTKLLETHTYGTKVLKTKLDTAQHKMILSFQHLLSRNAATIFKDFFPQQSDISLSNLYKIQSE